MEQRISPVNSGKRTKELHSQKMLKEETQQAEMSDFIRTFADWKDKQNDSTLRS